MKSLVFHLAVCVATPIYGAVSSWWDLKTSLRESGNKPWDGMMP